MGAINEICHFFETPPSSDGPLAGMVLAIYDLKHLPLLLMFNQKTLCLENYTYPYKVWHTYILKFSATSVSFSFRLYCWRGPMIATLCLKGTPDNITLTIYGIISLFKHWWLYFFVILVKEYSLALFQYYPFENRDAFMNLCPRLCVRNVVK